MTLDMWLALIILAGIILLFITEWLRVDVVALGVVVVLMVTGLLTPEEALSGFSNTAVMTIVALFIVGGAVLQTGLAAEIGQRILQIAGTEPRRLTGVIMVAVGLLSGFMSDTGTVAVMLPATVSLARDVRMGPSKLLIPLAFGALLGGATTLIGTPPNIIVRDLLLEAGQESFGFFDFTPIGLTILVAGVAYMLLAGRRLLPEQKPETDLQRVATPEELLDLYRLPEDLYQLRVRRDSDLLGKTLEEARMRRDFKVTVLEIRRPPPRRELARIGERSLALPGDDFEDIPPAAETRVMQDDIMIVQGTANDISHAAAVWSLGVQPVLADDEDALITNEVGVAEVLLPPRSSLNGKTLVDLNFGSRYRLTVLGIRRPGAGEQLDLKGTRLQFGDTLLVQGPWEQIIALRSQARDFVVVGEPEAISRARAPGKAAITLVILAGMLVLMVTNLLPLVVASWLAALAIILTGCLSIDEAYEAIDWKSVVLIAGMIPLAIALEQVGLVTLFADGLSASLGGLGPVLVVGGLFALTSLLTQVFSNTATTVLIAPIALATASEMGVAPQAYLMAVAIAASMAFASPVASPVNTLVMGAGGYRFTDYARVGIPLILLALVVSVALLPVLFPF